MDRAEETAAPPEEPALSSARFSSITATFTHCLRLFLRERREALTGRLQLWTGTGINEIVVGCDGWRKEPIGRCRLGRAVAAAVPID